MSLDKTYALLVIYGVKSLLICSLKTDKLTLIKTWKAEGNIILAVQTKLY